jgi:hypothetical protein
MARILSKHDDFVQQVSMLETIINNAGHDHECIFLPKFHCELNPIEMVCFSLRTRPAFLVQADFVVVIVHEKLFLVVQEFFSSLRRELLILS